VSLAFAYLTEKWAMDEEHEAPVDDVRSAVVSILVAAHGKTTSITESGRENMRTVNKLSRILALHYVANDRTFHHNLTRYRSDALTEDIVVGARREGHGVWSLVAELVPHQDP
jgi:hypothetical protein